MPRLGVRRVEDDESMRAWQHVHNVVIPDDALTVDEVRERSARSLLHLATVGDLVVGCSTVRPATDEDPVTVIVRILPEHRGQGLGAQLYDRVSGTAAALGATTVQTIVLGSNVDGLRFAEQRGFVETERYVLDGGTVPYIHLVRDGSA